MEQYRTAIVREILFRCIPVIVIITIAIIAIVIIVKFIGVWKEKYAKILVVAFIISTLFICGLIMFFDTKLLFFMRSVFYSFDCCFAANIR